MEDRKLAQALLWPSVHVRKALIYGCLCGLQDELPEALLGAVRLQKLDLSQAATLDIESGKISGH